MKLPQGTIKFASVCLFLVLAMSFMAAQKPLTRPDGDSVPNGKHGDSGQPADPVKGPVGQAVVTGNGINYHCGPVMKGKPVHPYILWYANCSGSGPNLAAHTGCSGHFLGIIG